MARGGRTLVRPPCARGVEGDCFHSLDVGEKGDVAGVAGAGVVVVEKR